MSTQQHKIKIKFKKTESNFIDNHKKFLEKCYKLFKIDENEKKNLKIYLLDEDDESELAIENENDFKDQQVIKDDNNAITYILKLEGKSEPNKNDQPSEHQTQDNVNDNENNDNKKMDNIFEENKNNNINNEDKNDKNNECKNNIDFSKIIESLKEENKKFQNEIIESLKNMETELKKTLKYKDREVKLFLMEMNEDMKKNNEDMKKNNEENKENNTNMEKELKNQVKKSISEVKAFLMTIEDGMKQNLREIQNYINENNLQNYNNDKKLDKLKNEIINKIQSIEQNTKNNNKKFKNLEITFDRIIISSPPKSIKGQNMDLKRNKGNDNNQIIDDIFLDVKQKIEEDYSLSSTGWSDEELKNKIKGNLNNDIKKKLSSNKDDGINEIVELIGEIILSLQI